MKYTLAFTLAAFLAGFGIVTSAQQVDAGSPRPSAAPTLPARSFEELRPRLRPGDKVIVRDAEGRTTRGRLSAHRGDQIEVEWRRWFRLRQRTFSETAVRRVEIEDSWWNGALIGLGVASAATGIGCRADDGGYTCLSLLLLAPSLGASVGAGIDLSINRLVYEAPGHATTTLSPVLGQGRIGLAARVRF
jgi:hypothetical protein